MLRCVAVCCSISQCVVMCCNCCSVLQCAVVCRGVLRCVAVCCKNINTRMPYALSRAHTRVSHTLAYAHLGKVIKRVTYSQSRTHTHTHTCTHTHTLDTISLTHKHTRVGKVVKRLQRCNSLQQLTATDIDISLFSIQALSQTLYLCNTLQHTASHCNTLQHTATYCNTLQHTAAHCNKLQHTATRCNNSLRQTHAHLGKVIQRSICDIAVGQEGCWCFYLYTCKKSPTYTRKSPTYT